MNMRGKIEVLLVFASIYCVPLFNIAKADTQRIQGVHYPYNPVSSGVTYPIDSLRFDTKNKIIFQIVMIGGVDWDGVGIEPLKEINYDHTVFILMNGRYFFKENIKDIDVSTLEVIYPAEIPPRNVYNVPAVLIDKKSIIYFDRRGDHNYRIIPIPSNVKRIHQYLWKDAKNNVYFAPQSFADAKNIFTKPLKNISLDANSLQRVTSSYFIDKNGLYWLATYFTGGGYQAGKYIQLAKTNGKLIKPTLHGEYLIYDGKIFSIRLARAEPLKMSIEEVLQIETRDSNIQKIKSFFQNSTSFKNMDFINFYKIPQIADTIFYTNGFEIIGYRNKSDKKNRLITDRVDFKTLQIAGNNLLIDKNNIYTPFSGGNFFDVKEVEPQLYVIPRDKLGIKIKIIDAIPYGENLLH